MTRLPGPGDWVWLCFDEHDVILTPDAYAEAASIVAQLPERRRDEFPHAKLVTHAAYLLEQRGVMRVEHHPRYPGGSLEWAVLALVPPDERVAPFKRRRRSKRPVSAGAPTLTVVPGGLARE